jgi:two-component system nitrogen regulation sensor histidine kinase NtrY
MGKKRRTWLLLLITVLLGVLALVSESLYFSDYEYHYQTRRFNRILHEKEKIMDDCLKSLEPVIASKEHHGSLTENKLFSLAEQNEITILEYLDDKLTYWSDNAFDVPLILEDSTYSEPFIFLQNGWFMPETIRAGNEVIVGLLRVRTDHEFENEIIRNGFGKDFRIPHDVGYSTVDVGTDYRICNSEGTFLFSLSFPDAKSNTALIIIPLLLWASLFILIIILSNDLVKILTASGRVHTGILFCLAIFGLLYFFLLQSGKPEVVFRTGLFSPYVFSLNGFIPSLGHLVLLSILAIDFAYMFYRYLPVDLYNPDKRRQGLLVISGLLLAAILLLCVLHVLFSHLITDSNISFEAYKVLKLSLFSIAGYASIISLFLFPLLLILKAKHIAEQLKKESSGTPGARVNKNRFFKNTVAFSVVFGLYSLFMITIFSEKKTTENMKIQALSFSTENDPEAEHLLLDIWPEMMGDSILRKMIDAEYFQDDFISISHYLRETYFSGYWGNYNYSIYLCRSDDPLEIGETGEIVGNCFDFFNERVRKYGHQLTGTGFWFIDNQGGRSYYLGQLLFRQNKAMTNGLFIELYSNVNVFQQGYSELLLDKKFRGYSGLKEYSFTKYINGEMVIKSGDFPYDKTDVEYVDKNSDYRIFNEEKFMHILYKNGNATVIISKPELNAGNILITFAYLFAFAFLFINLLLLFIRKPFVRGIASLNFSQKLQLTFIGILLFSFILIGVVVSSLTIKEYRSKHYENITEKLNSIYLELDTKLAAEKTLSPDWRNSDNSSLNELLVRLSNIFNTDINLYNLNGFLMATSREEIFSLDLTGLRMNNWAMINLRDKTRSLYTQTETIGRLKYVSAYVPFYNIDNEVLAWLNLPYFRMQSLLMREISNLIVAVINFTLLLVLVTMVLAVFISGRLTSPLSMLSEGLASVELGKKSEHLKYESTDEIGELVKQYNRMVDELDDSAVKLADSEREYAWREMAKQIAHEIKNPLTPMKLNVQQLLKSWKDGIPDFGEKIEGFSRNQIEYIDNLSSIASAFSTFAKMPGTNPMEIDLLEQVRSTLELFKNTDNVTFRVHWPHESKIFIFADREHLNGIFSNLFKNSIQAIPPDRKGLVEVKTEVVRNKVIISVHDNGSGIPEKLQKKMFTPNFTTKSSGTGLGLSIVKKYVEGANGRVWFESETGVGTIFHLEFPLMYTVERPGVSHNA